MLLLLLCINCPKLSVLHAEHTGPAQTFAEKITSSSSWSDPATAVPPAAVVLVLVLAATGAVAAPGLDAVAAVANALEDGDDGDACEDE